MTEEVKATTVMPWQENWELKPRQIVNDVIEKAVEVVEGVKKGKMPWDMDWKEKPRVAPSSPPAKGVNMQPSMVNVKTEAMMKKAIVIAPNEQMPDTMSAQQNLALIDKEIANTRNPMILRVLNEERKKYAQAR